MRAHGTDRPFAALRRIRPVTVLLSPSRRALRYRRTRVVAAPHGGEQALNTSLAGVRERRDGFLAEGAALDGGYAGRRVRFWARDAARRSPGCRKGSLRAYGPR